MKPSMAGVKMLLVSGDVCDNKRRVGAVHEIIFLKYSHPRGCWMVVWRLTRNKGKRACNKTMRPRKQI